MSAAPAAWLSSAPAALEERGARDRAPSSSRGHPGGAWGGSRVPGGLPSSSPARVGSGVASEARRAFVHSSSRQRCRESWLRAPAPQQGRDRPGQDAEAKQDLGRAQDTLSSQPPEGSPQENTPPPPKKKAQLDKVVVGPDPDPGKEEGKRPESRPSRLIKTC